MSRCDMCGHEDPYTEATDSSDVDVLCFDHRRKSGPEDVWRIARVCEGCREETLVPALRGIFQNGALNLNPAADDDVWEHEEPPAGALFWSFETEAGTRHAAREAKRRRSSPGEWRCVALCGIEAGVEPDAERTPLSRPEEGITCTRCFQSDPSLFAGTSGGPF